MTRSDQAMYQAMLRSDTHICEFNADLDRKTHERKALIEDLRQAIPKGQLELVFQLQNSVETLRPVPSTSRRSNWCNRLLSNTCQIFCLKPRCHRTGLSLK